MEQKHWPRDLDGYVFVLRALAKIVEKGIDKAKAREAICTWLLKEDAERKLALCLIPDGRSPFPLRRSAWAAPEIAEQIFDVGTCDFRYRPAQGFDALRPGGVRVHCWIQVPDACVAAAIPHDSSPKRTVTPKDIAALKVNDKTHEKQHGDPPGYEERVKFLMDRGISQMRAREAVKANSTGIQPGATRARRAAQRRKA